MKKRMLFVYNARAGKGLIKNSLSDIIDIFVKADYEVITHPTQKPRDAFEQVNEYAGQVDMIACSGGDGTLDEVVSGLRMAECNIPVCYIPAGSTNDFANSLFIQKDMIKAAEVINDGKLYKCDIGKFNENTFVYIAAFGIFTDVSYATKQDLKNTLGHVAYMLEGMKRLFDIKSYKMKIEVEDSIYEGDFIYGMITNSRSVGGFKNLTGKDVDMNDGLFEVTLIRMPRNPIQLQEIIGSLLLAEENTEYIHSFKARKIVCHSKESIPWTLDGEFGGDHTEVEIENLNEALSIYLEK